MGMVFPRRFKTDRLSIAMGVSICLHMALVLLLSLNPWPTIIKVKPTAYIVTLMPVSLKEPEIPKTIAPPPKEEIIKPAEKMKPVEKPKKNDIVEKVKKKERSEESLKHLQEAIEEIRKKAALDEIQKRVSKREVTPPPPLISPSLLEAKLSEYYSLLWAKIKASWTIPENLLKEKVDLETIIVVIIDRNGAVQKSWFEKKSGNEVYDQMAMRAIKKAEPLPPIPKEWSEQTLEIGIRFFPD